MLYKLKTFPFSYLIKSNHDVSILIIDLCTLDVHMNNNSLVKEYSMWKATNTTHYIFHKTEYINIASPWETT